MDFSCDFTYSEFSRAYVRAIFKADLALGYNSSAPIDLFSWLEPCTCPKGFSIEFTSK